MPTEFESEREQIATITEVLLRFRKENAEGKSTWTYDELRENLLDYAEEKKRHK